MTIAMSASHRRRMHTIPFRKMSSEGTSRTSNRFLGRAVTLATWVYHPYRPASFLCPSPNETLLALGDDAPPAWW